MGRGMFFYSNLFKIGFYIGFCFLFFLSVKKCFWRKEKSKVKLAIISIVANPFICFLEVWFFAALTENIFVKRFIFDEYEPGELGLKNNLMLGFFAAGYLLIAIFLLSGLTAKLFKIKEKKSVLFLFLMFNTISLISYRGPGEGGVIIEICNILVLYLAAGLFFVLDVKPFAEMIEDHMDINWSIFLVPPAIFDFMYVILISLMVYDKKMNESNMILIVFIFSAVVILLFVWAFNVIIKNIKATNEAVLAKDEVKTLSVEVMEALAHTIDAKDEYTRGHSVRVAKYSRMIAEKMNLSPEECESVYYMGLLHDIGKIGVPNEIINSPTKLTDDEYAIIKKHPGLGFDILAEIKSRPDLSIGARWHHERYDGKGYPDGKTGKDIPLFARIIAVADSYDAMTSNRSYRKYMDQEKVRSEIEKNMGTQFDPDVAKCMLSIMDEDVEFKLHE